MDQQQEQDEDDPAHGHLKTILAVPTAARQRLITDDNQAGILRAICPSDHVGQSRGSSAASPAMEVVMAKISWTPFPDGAIALA